MNKEERISHTEDGLIPQTEHENLEHNIFLILERDIDQDNVVPTELILDSYLNYYYNPSGSTLNSEPHPNFFFEKCGYTQIISTISHSKKVSLSLYKNKPEGIYTFPPMHGRCIDDSIDTPFGFKLSQVLKNLKNIHQIQKDGLKTSKSDEHASLRIAQKGFYQEKNGQTYLKFEFTISNRNSTLEARRVLFKDILPKGSRLCMDDIFLNDQEINKYNVDLNGRRLFIKIPVIRPYGSIKLSFICEFERNDGVKKNPINMGTVCAVGGNYLFSKTLKTIVGIAVSNVICLKDII